MEHVGALETLVDLACPAQLFAAQTTNPLRQIRVGEDMQLCHVTNISVTG